MGIVPSCLLRMNMNKNWTIYEYRKRNCVRLFRCERATVCVIPLPVGAEASGRRTYFRERRRKKALAKKVYMKIVHPTHPPVPCPAFTISERTKVTMTPTNLYPE